MSTAAITTKRQTPSLDDLRRWLEFGEAEFKARVDDMLEHADEYEHPLDLESYRQGLEDGMVAAFAAVDRDAEDAPGAYAHTVYLTARDLDFDGARVVQRVAERARQ